MALNDSISVIKQQLATEWLQSAAFLAIVAELAEDLGLESLAGPAVIYPHERLMPPDDFPAAELLGISSTPHGSNTSVQHYDHTIDVLWTVTGDDEARIVQHAETLVLATRRLTFVQVLPMPDFTTAPVIPGPEDYGPLMRSGRTLQPLVKAARIRLVIPTLT